MYPFKFNISFGVFNLSTLSLIWTDNLECVEVPFWPLCIFISISFIIIIITNTVIIIVIDNINIIINNNVNSTKLCFSAPYHME